MGSRLWRPKFFGLDLPIKSGRTPGRGAAVHRRRMLEGAS